MLSFCVIIGKYGDGSDVTTWKINFRCALNGLKDIIERKELEGPDCRVYQMLPTASSGTNDYIALSLIGNMLSEQ